MRFFQMSWPCIPGTAVIRIRENWMHGCLSSGWGVASSLEGRMRRSGELGNRKAPAKRILSDQAVRDTLLAVLKKR